MLSPHTAHCRVCGAALPSPGAECASCLLALGDSSLGGDLLSAAEPGRRCFAGYELLEEIARGGMGIVYRARQVSLGRTVALKQIASGSLATREFVHRFRTEAAAAAALHHPNIVAIHEVGVYDGNHFFSMEYVEGQNLAQLVGNRPLPANQAARYAKAIAEAIHYAHEQGILHRDLKPSNVLVDAATDQVRITDFGLAKRLDSQSSFTMTGQVIGSPHFMPPEQAGAQRGKVGRHSDIYAIGGILYYLLTARPPFQGDSLETVLAQVLNHEPVSPRLLTPNVPRDLETICLKCLNKEAASRYATGQEVADDLRRFLQGEPTVARPTTRLERAWRWCRRKPALASSSAAALLLLFALAIGAPIAALRINRARQLAEANLYAADMSLAERKVADDDLADARALLDRHRPAPGERDLRGFEWRRLWQICQNDEATALEPKVTSPRRVCVSSDGRLIAASDQWDGPAMIWDAHSKRLLKTLAKGDRALTFAPAEPILVTGGSGGLKVWNTLTWSNQYLSPCHFWAAARFSGDGRWLVVHGSDLQVWNTRTWTLVASNAVGEINSFTVPLLACSRDGSLAACGSGIGPMGTGKVHLFRLSNLEPLPFGQGLPATLSCLTFTPDDRQIVAGDSGGTIHIYEVATGKEILSRMTAPADLHVLAFSPADPNLLAAAGSDRTVRLWDFRAQKVKVALHHRTDEYRELAFAPDGTWMAAGGSSNPILIFPTEGRKPHDLAVTTSRVLRPLGFSADSRQLLTLNQDGELTWWKIETLALSAIRRLTVPVADAFIIGDGDVIAMPVTVTPDQRWLALGCTNGQVRLADLQAQTNCSFAAHTKMVRGIGFSPNSQKLATVGEDRVLRVWDLPGHRPLVSLPLPDALPDRIWLVFVNFSADGKYLVANSGRTIILWDAVHWRELKSERYTGDITANRLSPDARILASAAYYNYQGAAHGFDLWDTTSWAKRPAFAGHGMVWNFDWSPDGRRLVTLAASESILWDTDSWQELASFNFQAMIEFALFSPDGNKLALTDNAGALYLWRAPSLAKIEAQETKRGRWP